MAPIRDKADFEAFVQKYTPLARYVIAPILPNEHDRSDCLSEVISRAWEKREQFDETRGSAKSWLTAIARNTALNYARSAHDTEELSELTPSNAPTPEESAIISEQRRQLHAAVAALGERDRLLFYRKYYYMQKTAQIAAELGMTERAVEGRLYRIKRKLRLTLGGDGDER